MISGLSNGYSFWRISILEVFLEITLQIFELTKIKNNVMQIDERTKFMKLFDEYGKLLSSKQYEVMDKFLNLDIGESEMAELENASRQSVHDAISKAKKQLLEMENSCRFVRFKQELASDLSKCLEMTDDKLKEELAKIITKI